MGTITDYRQQWRRDTASNLASDNPTPEAGEPIFETDTGLFKIGDGATAYNGLSYVGQNLATGFIVGLETSNAADADHDITIATGKCRDYADTVDMILAAAITKQIDATWSAGDNAGGLFSGTVAADTTYHLFIIRKDSDGSIDAGFDTDVSAANIPSGYTSYRRIASLVTDGSANILQYSQHADIFEFIDPQVSTDATRTQLNTDKPTPTLYDMIIPAGLSLRGIFRASFASANINRIAAFSYFVVSTLAPEEEAFLTNVAAGSTGRQSNDGEFVTNTSGQIILYEANNNNISVSFSIATLGWKDDRGQYGGL